MAIEKDASHVGMGLENRAQKQTLATADVCQLASAGEVVRIDDRWSFSRGETGHRLIEDLPCVRVLSDVLNMGISCTCSQAGWPV